MMGGFIIGKFKGQNIGLPEKYFLERRIFLDCRGKLEIDRRSYWGYEVMVLTASHIHNGQLGRTFYRRVSVGPFAWICSRAILFNCRIGRGSIVAVGAVVRNKDVPDYTMVSGNPAQIVATFDPQEKRWHALEGELDLECLTDISEDNE